MKDAEKSIAGNPDTCSTFKSRLEKLPDNVVAIASLTQTDNRKEKVMFFQILTHTLSLSLSHFCF